MNEHISANRKIVAIFSLFILCFFVIIGRLFYLQILHYNHFLALSEKNFRRRRTLPPPRGSIRDCHGHLLATDHPVYNMYWMGTGNRKLQDHQLSLLKSLSAHVGPLVEDEQKKIRIGRAEKRGYPTLLAHDIDYTTLCQLSEQFSHEKNIMFESTFKRIYPHGSLASHLIGYVSQASPTSLVGKSGLEFLFQNDLEGTAGDVEEIKNAAGRRLATTSHHDAQRGNDVTLTIDLKLQQIAENLFEQNQAGAFLIFDPLDGAVKALVSRPHFDPNLFLHPLSHDEWRKLSNNNAPFLNRVIKAAYPPASLFKLVTFAAALEEGVITPETLFNCKGFFELGGRKFYCKRRWGHGNISGEKALAHSCNVYCYEIGSRLTIDQLADYATRFGLGYKTSFLLSEHPGLVPTTIWKQAHFDERWWKGETLSASIGQSYLLTTPLQIARMIGSIFTGYLSKPRLLTNEPVRQEPISLSRSTLFFLRRAMSRVTHQGTARSFKNLSDFTIFAKTGTAQTAGLNEKKPTHIQKEHAWFTAYFYYKAHRPLVLVTLVEHEGSSLPARVLAQKFFTA